MKCTPYKEAKKKQTAINEEAILKMIYIGEKRTDENNAHTLYRRYYVEDIR